ncbi:transposase family protein, partial [Streptomyces sp. NPDC052109]|uniref:transposase family protein n=1 Tax=Streptomyces sp. NPDC052109 TaxID=3155527 RepID=UPI00343B33A2
MRHGLAVVLALTACAVLAGATSLLAVGEWIADAPAHALGQLGIRPDPVLPLRQLPSESAIRRLLARIDGDALDRAVGRWLADRRPRTTGLHALAVDGKSLRGAARAGGRKIHLLAAPNTPPAWSWPSWASARRPTRSLASSRCWRRSPTWR